MTIIEKQIERIKIKNKNFLIKVTQQELDSKIVKVLTKEELEKKKKEKETKEFRKVQIKQYNKQKKEREQKKITKVNLKLPSGYRVVDSEW